MRSCLTVVCASAVWAGTAYTGGGLTDQTKKQSIELECTSQFSSALFFYDAMTVHLAAAASTVFVLYGFYAFAGQNIGTPVLQSIVVQVSILVSSACLAISVHRD